MSGPAFAQLANDTERERAAEITGKLLEKLSPEDRLILTLLHIHRSPAEMIFGPFCIGFIKSVKSR